MIWELTMVQTLREVEGIKWFLLEMDILESDLSFINSVLGTFLNIIWTFHMTIITWAMNQAWVKLLLIYGTLLDNKSKLSCSWIGLFEFLNNFKLWYIETVDVSRIWDCTIMFQCGKIWHLQHPSNKVDHWNQTPPA